MSESATEAQDGHSDPASLFDYHGRRKYLNAEERERFADAAAAFGIKIEALCLLLHFTGCRISEALALCPVHLDPAENIVILQTLKQRKRGVFRTVPVPSALMCKLQACCGDEDNAPIFGWHRSTAWEKVCAVFERAGISGPQATPRGARHGFGIAGVSVGIPITLVQRWLGHSRLETTSIYLAITGPEERDYAAKLWRKSDLLTPPNPARKEAA
ncbi:MAG: site-specific integrase [Pseudomonadota bacterium]